MTTLGSSVQPLGNLLPGHDLHDHLRAVPPAIAPHADPLNFCSPRIADPWAPWARGPVGNSWVRANELRAADRHPPRYHV